MAITKDRLKEQIAVITKERNRARESAQKAAECLEDAKQGFNRALDLVSNLDGCILGLQMELDYMEKIV